MKKLLTFSLLCLSCLTYAQAPINLGRVINSSLLMESNPSVNGNGKILIFQSNSGEDEAMEFRISDQNNGVWTAPATLPSINSAMNKLVYTGAPCIRAYSSPN